MSKDTERLKVICLGLDGATLDLIVPWAAEGRLPNIKRVMVDGCYGKLRSTIHPMSSVAWPSFMTGNNPGKHGIYDVTVQIPGSYDLRFTSGQLRKGRTLWGIMSQFGKRVCVINVPMTYPPEKVNGYMIAGMDAPDLESRFTYPSDLYSEIKRDIGKYCLEHGNPAGNKSLDEFISNINEALENRWEVMRYLMKRSSFDLVMTVFVATDRIQHYFWRYMNGEGHGNDTNDKYRHAIFNVYKKLDEIIGEIIDNLDANSILILMSDHGAGPVKKFINLNRWLEAEGLLVTKKRKVFSPYSLKDIGYSLSKVTLQILKRHLGDKQKKWMKKLFPQAHESVISFLFLSKIDWTQTKAYSTGYFGDIRINLKGREPKGIVAPGKDYEALRDRLIDSLIMLKDPDTGMSMVDRVYRREDIYHGEQLSMASDLIIHWKDYNYKSRINLDIDGSGGQIIQEPGSSFNSSSSIHKLDGILMMFGKHIKKGEHILGARIIDIAPTILCLSRVPIPENMDGKVLTEILDDKFLKSNPIKYFDSDVDDDLNESGDVYTEKEKELIKERLSGLGYIEE